jgi:hypothetical protein
MTSLQDTVRTVQRIMQTENECERWGEGHDEEILIGWFRPRALSRSCFRSTLARPMHLRGNPGQRGCNFPSLLLLLYASALTPSSVSRFTLLLPLPLLPLLLPSLVSGVPAHILWGTRPRDPFPAPTPLRLHPEHRMEGQTHASTSSSSGFDEFALLALRDATLSIESPTACQSQTIYGRGHMTSTFGAPVPAVPSFSAPSEDCFGISETSPSLLGLSGFDEYTNDPRFVESHRELRDLLFTSAQSLAPTRAASPTALESSSSDVSERPQNASAISDILSTRERLLWLRNYLEEVAPWVRRVPPFSCVSK